MVIPFRADPRLELYVLIYAQQGLAESCAYAIVSISSSLATRILAGCIFVAWPVGLGLLGTAHVLRRRVVRERRAVLARSVSRTVGYLRWVDASLSTATDGNNDGTSYTGFVDASRLHHSTSVV